MDQEAMTHKEVMALNEVREKVQRGMWVPIETIGKDVMFYTINLGGDKYIRTNCENTAKFLCLAKKLAFVLEVRKGPMPAQPENKNAPGS